MQLSRNFKVAIGVLAVLALAAFGVYCYQFVNGLGVTGMSNGTSWGLYIACFMFLVGLSAGGLIVASSASILRRWPCLQSSYPRCASAWPARSSSSTWAASSACGTCSSRQTSRPRFCGT